jgi:hypothetical protein
MEKTASSPLPEIARVLVRLDQIASRIVNADNCIMLTAAVHRVADCMIWRVVPQATEGQHIGNQIDAAMVFARSDFVNARRNR